MSNNLSYVAIFDYVERIEQPSVLVLVTVKHNFLSESLT
jgi:hypothetical protein